MSLVTPRVMRGALELLPREQIVFQRMLDTIRRGFERFGFLPVETPAMEYADVLLTKSGGETEKQVYFVLSTGTLQQGRAPDLALRFDLTVPLARYVAQHENELAFPFRRYQIQKVYRGETQQKGRFREFYQCDIDVIGKDRLSLDFDAEIPAVIYTVFRELDFGKFTILINDRRLLRGLLLSLGIADADVQAAALREIDKLDKKGTDAVRGALLGPPFSLPADSLERLFEVLTITGTSAAVLERLRRLDRMPEEYAAAVGDLEKIVSKLRARRVPEEYFRIHPGIARGLDYYTGTVYETTLDEHPEIGSVCSGGRYENLASHYSRSRLPGVGISIGLTRLFSQLMDLQLLPAEPSTTQILVTRMDDRLQDEYDSIGAELRTAGLNTESYLENDKIGRQLKYADRAGIRFVVIVGENEAAARSALVKDLKTGEQITIPRADLGARLRALCGVSVLPGSRPAQP